jgi:hypothetical protein
MLCIAGCLLVPAAAQASTWYLHDEEINETYEIGETPVPVATDVGVLDFTSVNYGGGIQCVASATASIWNEGETAKGSLEQLNLSSCHVYGPVIYGMPKCSSPKLTANTTPWGEKLPWNSVLPWDMQMVNSWPPSTRMEVKNMNFVLECPEGTALIVGTTTPQTEAAFNGEGWGGVSLNFDYGSGTLITNMGYEWRLKDALPPFVGLNNEEITLQ